MAKSTWSSWRRNPRAKSCLRRSPKKLWVLTWVSQGLPLFDGRFLENPKPLERSLNRIRVLQRTLSRKRFLSKNWIKTKIRLAKQHERVKHFRRDSLNSGFYSHRSTTS
ncbi:hypothetical protein B9Q11_01050 [Candidatus Marsarchaeota G2 archaeon ECH_B_SAG-F08]|uniref:Probable transposase IS891/IS1136/IS1341 domain-containing protein n=6 Tax=Candidatus Marsarchaeota TaxID=1978152 RepID=A0A2R6AHX4_9ARCH|nr:MAG: hypothetical protein B9Q01_03325 [Candidatus Marsarchaeota G1 archaeon OSP_D]PSN85923.1 MAG: hypothetical protein B9Q02_04400 [Candidatus Marsarchaeota G1 archaeon BE_D]PSN88598.1 MAG: hypothetical protein B9Q00_04780 [Candidatus Marsarchaeota G1 archaeon OSP_C]PSN99299.1 MAG: hypothetical protein B9Q11_01050 [Candidatus Marsarchaeota G2 archaeon ECH_B_SAG-F08]PSO02474.1 MAG: hypothetical protein B9Q10_01240 [Candidatus Marsarchaeota G2 archaeon ECH_B_SAG-E12]PSO04877.1 MAG: hypothetic